MVRLIVALVVVWGGLARAEAPKLPDRVDRLIGLAKVWGKVKVIHPHRPSNNDWDTALIEAIPKVEAATTIDAYRAALQDMLAKVYDPVTRMLDRELPITQPSGPGLSTPAPEVLEINMMGLLAGTTTPDQLAAALAKASVLLVDLRAPLAYSAYVSAVFQLIAPALPEITDWPLSRQLEHHGFRTQEGRTSGNYFTSYIVTGARGVTPGPANGPNFVVALADARSAVPAELLALQSTGHAAILAQERLTDEGSATTTHVEPAPGIDVQVRVTMAISSFAAKEIVDDASDLRLRGLGLARSKVHARIARIIRPVVIADRFSDGRADDDYERESYPSREERMLAGIRAWAILGEFWPYRDLVRDWDGVLREALPRLEAATDEAGYRKALDQLAVRTGDGHVAVYPADPPETPKYSGAPPVATRLVENKLAVVRILDAAAARSAGISLGDVIDKIDGRPTHDVLAERVALIGGSTIEARWQLAAKVVLLGADGSSATLAIGGRQVAVKRTAANLAAHSKPTTEPHWKTLPGNVGYVDLRTLVVGEVAPMFAALASTRAIVFDMRGYPNGTAWSIAPVINTRHAKYGAQFLEPLVTGDPDMAEQRIRFFQPIPELPPGAALYRGKVVVLIDDRAISQAEHTCLFFDEAAGATFVGSPTHGANGDVTVMRLPGGLRMSFTGQEVRHVDGRQLQQVGIKPTILIRPSLAGVRAGKDDVLDRALAFLATGK